jgi:type VI secretion system secreted protein VgrG
MDSNYTQAGRPIRVDTPLGEDVLLLEEFTGAEAVSQQFSFHLRAVSTNQSLPLEDLLQRPIVITLLQPGGDSRFIHGIVSRAVRLERSQGLTTYHLEVVPWTWFLSLITDCRIFENKTVREIIEQIFKDQGFQDYEFGLSGSYDAREYCVQYRETSLDFVSRLMEEEGIFYFFRHTTEKHTLIIRDSQSAFAPCPFAPDVEYGVSTEVASEKDAVRTIALEHSVRSRTISLCDYDFQNPGVKLDVRAASERYDLYDYPGKYTSRDAGERYAKLHLEEQEVQRVILAGTSNCRQFIAGYQFNLHDISGQTVNDSYVLLSVAHSASATSYRSSGLEPFIYENHFQAVPATVTYRPPRVVRRPLVQGSQTAVVVGPEGEEFWVDKFGRVKVHFFWDREEKNSCPVRVSSSWAGKNWGVIQIPRIGQEVVVDFLEGDPDRPLIIGRVYNAEQMPPYPLPADQTISGVKSRSSKGGGTENFNEIVLEDKKGSEFIRIHAEKDIQQHVENDSYEYVGKDRHLIVDGSQAEMVTGDKHLTVQGERREAVQGNVSFDFSGNQDAKVGNVFSLESGQEVHIKGGMKVIIEAGMQLSLIGPGGFVDIGPAGVTIQGTLVKINSGGSQGSGTAAAPQVPKKPTQIT